MERKKVKIVTIGGGSSYTPELIEGFINRYEDVPVKEMWLVDVEKGKDKLEIIGKMAQRMWDASPYDVKVYTTLNRREALVGADFVTTQFRVGQLEARIKDERIPLSYGMIGQETNGAGGIFKALRTIPVILDIVSDMKELCPDAWLINFTNPSGMVTESVLTYGKWDKVIGLCNSPYGIKKGEPAVIGKKPEELLYRFGGLNHFHWHKVYDPEGNDVTMQIVDAFYRMDDLEDAMYFREQIDQMKMIPNGYHRYYYRQEEMLKSAIHDYETIGTRGQQVKEIENKLFEMYKDPDLNYKPKELEKRGGAYYSEVACETIAAIYTDSNAEIVVTTRNGDAMPDLPEDCAVEVTSYIGKDGAKTVSFGKLDPPERGWLQCMKNMEMCVEYAAVHGDYGMLLQAFTLNPLIPSGATAKRVMDELLIAHERYLPQFKDVIAKLKEEGVTVKDETVRKIMAEE